MHICFYLVALFQNYLFVTPLVKKFKFCCQSCDVIVPPKTVKIENQKTLDCLEYKVLPSANFELKGIKAAKVVPKWPHLASCLPTVSVTVLIGITSSSYITKCSIIKKCYNYTWNAFLYIPSLFTRNPHKCSTVVLIPEPQITHGVGVLGTSWTLRQSTLIK